MSYFDKGIVKDDGILLCKSRGILSKDSIFVQWYKLKCDMYNGAFRIWHKDHKFKDLCLSYIENDNTHILEAMIRGCIKMNSPKLSYILLGPPKNHPRKAEPKAPIQDVKMSANLQSIVVCPYCSQKISVPYNQWLQVTCPTCKKVFEVKP